ncbi:helix-turn-helix domain-containing protein [Egicoccus sp. AB-alg2]|uniref:helix-turn-helix domain-containing protein n=1 Tax=Egicoccus sp. AB-alg2 TaxID=3242693 RepID=UPI00359D40FF
MGGARTDLLLHPVRIRVVQAAVGCELTTGELAAALPDVPTASLYRHVRRLVDGGVLEVVAERPVRGTVERTYRVALDAASLDPDDVAGLSPHQHVEALAAFTTGLLQSATRYLDDPVADPAGDGFGYRQVPMWADDEEFAAFVADLRAVLRRAAERGPGPGRRRRTLTTVVVPDPLPPGAWDEG